MVQKRSLVGEELINSSAKLPRLAIDTELFPVLEFVPPESALKQPSSCGDFPAGFQTITEDIETSACNQILVSHWATGASTVDDDVRSGAGFHGYFSNENFNSRSPIRTFVSPEEFVPSFLVHSSRNLVPIGKDHQADLPTWGTQGTADPLNYLHSSEPIILLSKDPGLELSLGNDNESKLMGACLISMPDSEQPAEEGLEIGKGRTGCSCLDSGSLRCVRKHIMEEREKLKRTLGQEKFLELGFGDMGEEVAEKWSEEEEQTFDEVILSNPASVGKKFWDTLANVFPYKSKKDIVSYYFNVFMLRQRAEQNRCDSMDIDSDNDEWQGSVDYSDNEPEAEVEDEDSVVVESPLYEDYPGCKQNLEDYVQAYDEDGTDQICLNNGSVDYSDDEPEAEVEDEDSVVESPLSEDYPGCKQNLEDYVQAYDEDGTGQICLNNGSVDSGCFKGMDNILDTCAGTFFEMGDSYHTFEFSEKTPWEEKLDRDVQEDSGTSSDTGLAAKGTQVMDENIDRWPCHFKGLSNVVGHGYVLEPCDAKVWDCGYFTCPRYKTDLLPTYSVIEEVFGDVEWNLKENDVKGSW